MNLLMLILVLVAVGIIYGLLGKYGANVGLDGRMIQIIQIVILAVTVLWLLTVFGVIDAVRRVSIPTMR